MTTMRRGSTCAVFLCLTGGGAMAQCDIVLGSATNNPTSATSTNIASADLNGDGRPDLVVGGGGGSRSVSVLYGTGSGSFSAPLLLAAPAQLEAVQIGDLNGDGAPDIVAGGFGSPSSISAYRNNGNGTFGSASPVMVGGNALSFSLVELNGDGRLDIAAAVGSDLAVLLGNGDGTFQPAMLTPLGGSGVWVAAGDVNGDGRADIVVSHSFAPAMLSLFRGNGDGTFGMPQSLMLPGIGSNVAVGDVNGDGLDDVVVASHQVSSIVVMVTKPSGELAAPVQYPAEPVLRSIALGDLDGDGRLDAAATSPDEDLLTILPGFGDGTFGEAMTTSGIGSPGAVWVGDVNLDALPDVLIAHLAGGIRVRRNQGGWAGIVEQPQDVMVDAGSSAVMSVDASNALTHRWRRNGALLVDGAEFQGVTTDTLTIVSATGALRGVYDVLVGSLCGAGTTSRSAALLVGPGCPADIDLDGAVRFGDLNEVLGKFNLPCP